MRLFTILQPRNIIGTSTAIHNSLKTFTDLQYLIVNPQLQKHTSWTTELPGADLKTLELWQMSCFSRTLSASLPSMGAIKLGISFHWILVGWYCWWLKSCTTWDVGNPKNNGIYYLSTGAGFLSSTVGILNIGLLESLYNWAVINSPLHTTMFSFHCSYGLWWIIKHHPIPIH